MNKYYLVETGGSNSLLEDRGRVIACGTLQDMQICKGEARIENRMGNYAIYEGGQEMTRLLGGKCVG